MNYRAFTVLYFLILGFVVKAHALELPHLIGENMVVQRVEPVPIWGWAEPGSEVHLVFNQKIKSVNAGADGAWRVSFPKMKAGGPYRLKIQNNDKSFQFDNIWSGDVWVCSG